MIGCFACAYPSRSDAAAKGKKSVLEVAHLDRGLVPPGSRMEVEPIFKMEDKIKRASLPLCQSVDRHPLHSVAPMGHLPDRLLTLCLCHQLGECLSVLEIGCP